MNSLEMFVLVSPLGSSYARVPLIGLIFFRRESIHTKKMREKFLRLINNDTALNCVISP